MKRTTDAVDNMFSSAGDLYKRNGSDPVLDITADELEDSMFKKTA